jgi:hypothetical protein
MNNLPSAKELERRAFQTTFEDGLWDILLGLLLLLMGTGPVLSGYEEMSITVIAIVLGLVGVAVFLGFFLGKKLITLPRIGRVRFGEERQRRLRKTTLVLSVSVLAGLIAFFSFFLPRLTGFDPGPYFPIILFAVNCVVVFSLAAWYLDYGRAYLYGWLYAASFPLGMLLMEYTRFGFHLVYGLFALPMVAVGVVLLVRFLRANPVPRPDEGGVAA